MSCSGGTGALSSTLADILLVAVLNAVKRTFDERRPGVLGRSSSRQVSTDASSFPTATLADPGSPSTKPPMSRLLASLLVYTVGVKHRGFNRKESYLPTHVISFGENRLAKLCSEPQARQDLLAHCRSHLVRAYPKGSRLSSTNYLPHQWWAVGVQMASVNWQTWDLGMAMNAAMFARAGRGGYVLKPERLRRKGGEKDKETWRRGRRYELYLEVIGGHQLPRVSGSGGGGGGSGEGDGATLDPFVEVSLFVPGAPSPVTLRRRTKVVAGNAFNPLFDGHFVLPFEAHPSPGMLDLVFLRLEVLAAKDKGDLPAPRSPAASEPFDGKGEPVGAFVVGLGVLKPGYRHLPLYDGMGDQHLYSSLFVKTEVREVGDAGGPPLPSAAEPTTAATTKDASVAPSSRVNAKAGVFWRRSSSGTRSESGEGNGSG